MELTPVSNNKLKVDLTTPTEALKTQEITPDNPKKPSRKSLLDIEKVPVVGFSQKLSKRKLFGKPVNDDISGPVESLTETAPKKRRSDLKNNSNDGDISESATAKPHLTERQQLAFLLEATSMHKDKEQENDQRSFTKIKSHKGTKGGGAAVHTRVHRRNERGETPLHLAAIKGDVTSLKKLIKDGADVGVKDYAGWTALHEACNHGNLAAAQLLVKHGASVNSPGFEGDTPLHDAVINNHFQIADMLLSSGANPSQMNMKRKKPIDFISSKEMSEVFTLCGIQHSVLQKQETVDLELPILSKSEKNVTKTPTTEKVSSVKDCTKQSALISDMQCEETRTSADNDPCGKSPLSSESHLKETWPPVPDNERCVKSTILGNEIQCKETKGESKMEKPVMYICKLQPRNDERSQPTLRTTKMTSNKKFSEAEVDEESRNSVTETQHPPKEEVLDKKKTSSQMKSFPARHKVQRIILKLKSALSHHACDQTEVKKATSKLLEGTSAFEETKPLETDSSENKGGSISSQENTNVALLQSLPSSEELTAQVTEVWEKKEALISGPDEANERPEDKLWASSHGSEESAAQSNDADSSGKKQVVIGEQRGKMEDDRQTVPLPDVGSEDASSQEKITLSSLREGSRTPEAAESIALEVLSTGLFSGDLSQYYCTSAWQNLNKENTGHVSEEACQSAFDMPLHDTSALVPLMHDVPSPEIQVTLGEGTTAKACDQLASNEEGFLDVEGLNSNLREDITAGSKIQKRVSSTSSIRLEDTVTNDAKTSQQSPDSMNDRVSVSEGRCDSTGCSSKTSLVANLLDDEGSQLVDSLLNGSKSKQQDSSKLNDRCGEFILVDILQNTGRREESECRSSVLEHTGLSTCSFDKTNSGNDGPDRNDELPKDEAFSNGAGDKDAMTTGRSRVDLPSWKIEAKGFNKRGRKTVGLRNASCGKEDRVSRRGVVHQGNMRWTDESLEERGTQNGCESSNFALDSTFAKPKSKVAWQSLMAVGRCRLAELRIPGYNQFLMKTKQYELATDERREKSIQETVERTLSEEKRLSIKHEECKKELQRKQKSEQEKLQLCMEQEIVRCYSRKVYNAQKCNPPPGVCTAIYWQSMSSKQLENEKKKLSQKPFVEQDQTSDHQEIIAKYMQIKRLMVQRHKHEEQSLDSVIQLELKKLV